MKVGVKILPRDEVLDSQGRAVEKTLSQHGHQLHGCRVGKYIMLDIEADSEEQAKSKAKEITEFVLYNPLVEKYEIEVFKS